MYPAVTDTQTISWSELHGHVVNLVNNVYIENFPLVRFMSLKDNIYTILDEDKYTITRDRQTNYLMINDYILSEDDYLYRMIAEFDMMV